MIATEVRSPSAGAALFALAIGGFGIGTTEFATMGLLPQMAGELHVSVPTMGHGITRLQPVGGFAAETAGAATVLSASYFGIPVSTTHCITGSILGVGTTRGLRAVRWIAGQRIMMAWVFTLPCSAFMSAVSYLFIHLVIEPFLF